MHRLIVRLLCVLLKVLLSLRYRITIKGLEHLKSGSFNQDAGILFLPNHPAHIDPLLLTMILYNKFQVRPLAIEYIYRQKAILPLMKLVKALPIPNFESSSNQMKLHNVKTVINEVVEGVKNKENFILYPAGRLKHTGKEILGGASAAHKIVQQVPGINIVLARTTGLWGSSFSRAYTDYSPDLKTMITLNFKRLLKGLIFFLPRRKVTIEFSVPPEGFPALGSRLEFNKALEGWYNRYPADHSLSEVEPLYQVSYSPWREEYNQKDFRHAKILQVSKKSYSSAVEEQVFAEISRISKLPVEEINLESDLAVDLGMDSLDIAELVSFLGVHFEIGEVHPEDVETVQAVLEIAEGRKKTLKKVENSKFGWPEEKEGRSNPELSEGSTIPEAFLNICAKMKNRPAVGDDMLGPLSYKKMKLAALVLAEEFRQQEGRYIAIMLPSSVGAYLVILAVCLAGKVPVMLNWTTGPRFLNHMMEITGAKIVVSSWKFLERLSNVDFGNLTDKIRYMEDIKQGISRTMKIKGLLSSFRSTKGLLRALKLDRIKPQDPAVILFTSGTESAPKGVPLSHENLLTNQRASLQCANFVADDVMVGILPPFHSFGFSMVGLLPILAGMKAVYSPDPTDSYTVADVIDRWRGTTICFAPNFLKGLLLAATPKQVAHVRLFVTGAEKASKDLFDKVKALGGRQQLIEGYGITECSPVISLNRPGSEPGGVGHLLPGIEACLIHPETHKPQDRHREGEICVRGTSVFAGYLDKRKSPFIEIDGQNWYCTGDLGYFDDQDRLILSGRLKRFTKIGGEMVSLSGLEEVIMDSLRVIKGDDESFKIAVCANEKEGDKSFLIMFSTDSSIDKTAINTILKEAGFSRLIKISDIKEIEAIPLMGTGKTDYRFLQSILEQSYATV